MVLALTVLIAHNLKALFLSIYLTVAVGLKACPVTVTKVYPSPPSVGEIDDILVTEASWKFPVLTYPLLGM